jgi:uncharacterized membrane protein
MERLKSFIKTSIIGGLAVILPTALLIIIFKWLFIKITDIIQPLTNLFVTKTKFQEAAADAIVIATILAVFFTVGIFVRTQFGHLLQEYFENRLLKIAPGYSTIKAIVNQFFNRRKSPFSTVALVRAFQNDTLMTAFITDQHDNGLCTVFVPTGPNPTTGFVFHLKKEFVHPIGVSVQEAFQSIIGCGAGSDNIIDAYTKQVTRSGFKTPP